MLIEKIFGQRCLSSCDILCTSFQNLMPCILREKSWKHHECAKIGDLKFKKVL